MDDLDRDTGLVTYCPHCDKELTIAVGGFPESAFIPAHLDANAGVCRASWGPV